MENLIDFDEPQSKPMNRNNNKVFGIIRRDCFAPVVTGIEDSCGETLKCGTLIQIIPDYGGAGCHFMIRNFSNWLDKYKTTIYKCPRDYYIVVTEELWPYLLSMENDENQRIKLVQNVYSRKFNLDMVKLGNEIRIRKPLRNKADHYYEFIVTHNGVVKEQGTGYYIGLRLKNELDSLTSNLEVFSRHYRFGGKGIVVSVDWIMLNLYKEEYQPLGEVLTLNSITPKQITETNGRSKLRNFSSETAEIGNLGSDAKATVCPNKNCNHVWINPRNAPTNNGRCPKCNTNWCFLCSNSHEPGERHGSNSAQMRTKNKGTEQAESNATVKRGVERSSTITERPKIKSETGAIPKTRRISHETPSEINLSNPPNRMLVKCNLCSKRIVIGSKIYLSQCLHEFCKQCITKYIEKNSKNSLIRCPYNKEYVCKINLLDNEIKKFGGELVYKKILDNRLKESRGADPNAIVCSNEACRNIWMSPQNKLANFDRCSKCKTCWCYICSSVHEPGERHGKNLDNTRNVIEVPKTELGACDKCPKSKIPVNECDTVQKCNHKFCNSCILPMIKARTSGSQNVECVICRNQNQPEEDKIKKITGFEMLKEFLHDRDNQKGNDNQMKLCCCVPPAQNCFFTLKCKHQFCRTFLIDILSEQHQRISRAACPSCLGEIDDYEIKRLVDQMKTEITEKCFKCSNPADMELTVCRHPFCNKCVRNLITNQAEDPYKMSIDCSTCQAPIIDTDILQYGNKEIFDSKPVNRTLNDQKKFQCILCARLFSNNCRVILTRCKDSFCIACCKEFIHQQLSKFQMPTCPVCDKPLEQLQMEAILGDCAGALNSSKILISCLNCEEKLEERFINKCSKCLNTICLGCAKSLLLDQLARNRPASCSFCERLLEAAQIATIKSYKPSEQNSNFGESNGPFSNKQGDRIQLGALQFPTTNEATVEPGLSRESSSEIDTCVCYEKKKATCSVCYEKKRATKKKATCAVCYEKFRDKIVLKNCKHEFCRQCVQANVAVQQSNGTTPRCPMCRKSIEREEITKLKTLPPVVNAEVSRMNRETSLRFNNRQFDCPICDQNIDEECGVVLANCRDSLCRDCILSVLLQQSAAKLAPNCPMCQTLITDEEVRELDSAIHDIFVENRLHVNLEGRHDFEMPRRDPDIVETFFCSICQTFDKRASTALTFCDHKFCRPCITAALNDQNMNNKIPTCPMCNFQVSDLDIFDLCGLNNNIK